MTEDPKPVYTAPQSPRYAWPDGKRSAVFISFDVDAESAWLSGDAKNARRLVTLSYGAYEARVGVPKLLDMLRQKNVPATFFVTGWTVDAYPGTCEAILADGHEIAHHGYMHYRPDLLDRDGLEAEIDRALDAMQRHFGLTPIGYRAPYGETTVENLTLLTDRGLRYSSSFRDDIHPYRHVLDGMPGPVELPVNTSFDDWTYGLTHRSSPRALFTREHVLNIWNEEFDQTREWGGLTTTVLHPQVSGRPMRINILDQFIDHVAAPGDTWLATGAELCQHFETCEKTAEAR